MRKARLISSTNMYHVMLRGVNHLNLFSDDEDYQYFREILKKCKEKSNFELYAFCIMGNHVHLLIKNIGESIGDTMRRIENSYHFWFRSKYGFDGSLFGGRFKSEPVETEKYFRTLISYIHNNPVNAGICNKADEYEYSSIHAYKNKTDKLINVKESCAIFCANSVSVILHFIYSNKKNNNACMDIKEMAMKDSQAMKYFNRLINSKGCGNFSELKVKEKSNVLRQSLRIGISFPQLRRFLGIPFKQLKLLII